MKKIFLLVYIILSSVALFAQVVPPAPQPQDSNTQLVVAVMVVIGAVIRWIEKKWFTPK